MDIQTAIAILETKKLTCCNQKEFMQAADMAIAALQQQVPKSMNFKTTQTRRVRRESAFSVLKSKRTFG